jgi:hypothetical protein
MHSRSRSLTSLAATLLTVAAVAAPIPLAAQSAGPRPLFLAIPEVFPDVDARAVVVRETAREIVLLRATDATAETLGVALALLRRVRERPVQPGRSVMLPITGFVVTNPPDVAARERLDDALERLKAQPLAAVGTLGPGRSIRYTDGER